MRQLLWLSMTHLRSESEKLLNISDIPKMALKK